MLRNGFIFLLIYLNFFVFVVSDTFKDVTSTVFSDGVEHGILAAFGDFTANKKVDLFIITNAGKTLKIVIAHTDSPIYGKESFSCSLKDSSSIITSVVPADYNGDTYMDVLISIKEKTSASGTLKIKILPGYKNKLGCDEEDTLLISMKGQPLVLDYDGDGIADLFGEDDDGHRSLWKIKNNTFVRSDVLKVKEPSPIKYPNSNAFVDLTGDLQADIFLTTDRTFELWINKNNQYTLDKIIYRPDVFHFYQAAFCDLSATGILSIIAPVCKSEGCDDSAIYAFHEGKWEVIGSDFYHDGHIWKFIVPEDDYHMAYMLQPTLRIADLNMDGFPDIMVVMYSNVDKVTRSMVFIMLNVPTNSNPIGRKFNISYSVDIHNASTATFHDIFENGQMDLLITAAGSSSKKWKIHAFKNIMAFDAYFLKVIVLSGHCKNSCHNTASYGVNIPGATVRISTTNSDDVRQFGARALFPQTAYFSLHVPYMIFGLGQTPNFVEKLRMGLPNEIDSNEQHDGEWKQIIPNSQVIIVPYPLDKPSSWYIKLFLTPSKLVIQTSCALIGTCVLISLIILLLHWKEKREDLKEKQQNAHRFHFNAM